MSLRSRLSIIFVLMAILSIPITLRAEETDSRKSEVLNKISETLTTEDLDYFAKLVLNNEVTMIEIMPFYEGLFQEHKDYITEVVIKNLPPALPERVRTQPDDKIISPNAPYACDPSAYPACWRQFIEVGNGPWVGKYYPQSGYKTQYNCDSDPDWDVILYYSGSFGDPNNIRWNTDNAGIAFLMLTNGSNLNGYGLNTNNTDVRLCIPTRVSERYTIAQLISNIFIYKHGFAY